MTPTRRKARLVKGPAPPDVVRTAKAWPGPQVVRRLIEIELRTARLDPLQQEVEGQQTARLLLVTP